MDSKELRVAEQLKKIEEKRLEKKLEKKYNELGYAVSGAENNRPLNLRPCDCGRLPIVTMLKGSVGFFNWHVICSGANDKTCYRSTDGRNKTPNEAVENWNKMFSHNAWKNIY